MCNKLRKKETSEQWKSGKEARRMKQWKNGSEWNESALMHHENLYSKQNESFNNEAN